MKFRMTVLILLSFYFSSTALAKGTLTELFEQSKPIMAALYLELPADIEDQKAINELVQWGLDQQRILEQEGVDAILWEYQAGDILEPELSPQQIEVMGAVIRRLSHNTSLVVGVEVLWHYPRATLMVAKLGGAQFIRLDFFSDRMIADGKEVPINPRKILRYRRQIGAQDIVMMTDIQVKYAEMVDRNVTMTQSARNAIAKGSDAVVVSGKQSGQAPSAKRVELAKRGARDLDVVIGSGFSYQNAPSLLRFADAVIVGTSISEQTGGPLERYKVKRLMKVVNKIRKGL